VYNAHMERTARGLRAAVLVATLVGFALWPGTAFGSVTVNTTTDSSAAGGCMGAPGDCSLRQAIAKATAGDTVIVPAGTYSLSLGSLGIGQPITVQGAGARTTAVVVATGSLNAFAVNSATTATISGLTVSAGHLTGSGFFHGGAILNASGSALRLDADTIAGTTLEKTDTSNAPVRGAGIANNGTLTITNSTVSGNVELTTGAGNANQGAGLFNSGGTVSIVNSTIAGNSQAATSGASSRGAGIENLGTTIDLQNVTIAGNAGSANVDNISTVNAKNTIVANGASGNCTGALTSQGHNIESANECGFHAAGDQIGTDPLLGALGDNGGPTDTEALLAGSPAIDHGDQVGCPPTDQRGIARPQEMGCDVGAFEFVPPNVLPSNAFSFGKVHRNKRKGTATIVVNLPGSGSVSLSGKGVVPVKRPLLRFRQVAGAGPVSLKVSPKRKTKKKLKKRGKAKVTISVTFTPTGGLPNTQSKGVKLIKRR
jgi:hypothetical protein